MKPPDVYIVAAYRSPVGKFGGALKNLSAPEIMVPVIKRLLKGFEAKDLDRVLIGNVLSAGIGQNPARIAAIKSNIPNYVPSITINQVCASGLAAVNLAAQQIQTGKAHLVLAGGMESMSNCPYYLAQSRFANKAKLGDQTLIDGMILDGLYCSLTEQHMGKTAENLVSKYRISRKAQDKYAMHSHQKAIAAMKTDIFRNEIIPIKLKDGAMFETDEQPRSDSTLEKLAGLKPAFLRDGTVTAGNSSSINDGAAAVLLASATYIKQHRLRPLAKIIDFADIGLDPAIMGLGAFEAAHQTLSRSKLQQDQIDLWEINEAFAAQMLAVLKKLNINQNMVNISGGGIALGHPLGASGARILVTLIHGLIRTHKSRGLASLCVGGGQGAAMIIERV